MQNSIIILRLFLGRFLMVPLVLISCRTPEKPQIDYYNLDYYFTRNSLTVQGNASLPPVKSPDKGGRTFISIEERRKICTDTALKNAHIKWLSLTSKDRQDPSEWKLRLELGARDKWSECLKSSEILNVFYDSMDSCRAVVFYPCLPVRY